jgi:ABC-2 type transport system ATP-binding protein
MSISVRNLTKYYGEQAAVNDISFDVNTGEILGFLGPNGAGKTTTMKIITCYMPPSTGSVEVDGMSIFDHSLEVRKKIGYLPEMNPLYHDMNVLDYLEYAGQLAALRGAGLQHRIKEMVHVCGLESVRHKDIGEMSKGYRQRVGLADSLLHEPEVLILDEPTMGLDPNQIRRTRNLIRSLARRYTVLLSSHILHEVESVCERVLIINRGRIVASDTTENLVALIKGYVVAVAEMRGPHEEIARRIQALPGLTRAQVHLEGEWTHIRVESASGRDLRTDLFHLASLNGWLLRELCEERRNLEDVFVAVTDDGDDEPGAVVAPAQPEGA